jgi:Tol biopolymer transport system component
MQSDGSNVHSLGPNGAYQWGIDWSPDGQWLLAVNAITGTVDVVNATSGLTLPLGFTKGAVSSSWRQTPH